MRFLMPNLAARVLGVLLFGWLSGCGARTVHDDFSARRDAGSACAVPFADQTPLASTALGLRIGEVVSANDGVYVDELGESDDWLELENAGPTPLMLSDYVLSDSAGNRQQLPALELAPGAVALFWADDELDQGAQHLPMKLSAGGEQLTLWRDPCTPVERVLVPPLAPNEIYARSGDGFVRCRYATPGRPNAGCEPPGPPALREDVHYAPYQFADNWPDAPSPLAINELALAPAQFIELVNTSAETLTLSEFTLRLAPIAPSAANPSAGVVLPWPSPTLEPGAYLTVPVRAEDLQEIAVDVAFEGAALLTRGDASLVDRVPFMSWPEGATLVRSPDARGLLRFCSTATPGARNVCGELPSRVLGDRAHALRTPEDFLALARGGSELGQSAVKFVVDMDANDLVHLLSAERWALHYTFVRERVYLEPALDRCDPAQAQSFELGWWEFSEREYFRTLGRRFLLGTLVRHANGLQTVEFAAGDTIDAPLMRRAFLAAIAATPNPRAWSLRPADDAQIATMRELEGSLPIVGPNAPFADLTQQTLTRGETFGLLRFVPAAELDQTALSERTLVVTDDVPNDVPFVAGLITEAFQTPLSHVNVLSQARGTPNLALRHARDDARIKPLLGKLVRLEVGSDDFNLREATLDEVERFWEARRPRGPRIVPPSDLGPRGLLPLAGRGLADAPSIGAKAAQFAELYRVTSSSICAAVPSFRVPDDAFALPFTHYREHFVASGAADLLRDAQSDPTFISDASRRAQALASVRAAILQHPVAPELLRELEDAVLTRFGTRRVRFRSSSNVEDLPTFNGAGLHTSTSAELDDPERSVALALRTVWASLWELRAFDERENANLDHDAALMGVLVHAQFGGEAAQGVGISRDLLDITRDDIYYINVQRGEASVTNPAPGVTTEQLLYALPPRTPEVSYRSRSSFRPEASVLSLAEVRQVACALSSVHAHFRPLLDPTRSNHTFAMQIEFKFERDGALVVKQARPQPFDTAELPADCR